MCDHHLELWATQGDRHHAHQLLEFIAGARSEGLREVLAAKHRESIEQFAQVVRDGQNEGLISPRVDAEQVAWLVNGWAFAGDVAHLMGFKQFLEPNIAVHWLDVIFASFEAAQVGRRSESAIGGARGYPWCSSMSPTLMSLAASTESMVLEA